MRILRPMVLAVGFLWFSCFTAAQSGLAQNDSSSTTAAAVPADDPAFVDFPPITPGVKPPKAVSAPDPKYPDLPDGAEPRGSVVLLIGITSKGHVGPVQVLRSDEVAFEKSAVTTVRKWKFKPAQQDSHPVPVRVTVEMKFQR